MILPALLLLPAFIVPVFGDIFFNPAPQIFFPNPDDALHPEWSDRQAALNAHNDVGGCGGVCVLTPEVMEGPFYLDYHLDRSNITETTLGVPLSLTLTLYQISSHLSSSDLSHTSCEPLKDAWVDIWSCDNEGVYSGYGKAAEGPPGDWPPPPPGGPGGPGGPGRPPHKGPHGPGGHAEPSNNSTFLRGIQQTDHRGKVTFDTIYPGWYPGRTVHIHLKVHPPLWAEGIHDANLLNSTHTHTTQLFLEQSANDQVSKHPAYSSNVAKRVKNDQDMLYRDMNGASVLKSGLVGEGLDDGIWAEGAIGIDRWW
ncbi:uncharacterized protein IL334_004458 [Kwoniella shivajii]|uniref:Intradiol ring-cleavage dioxygenases domain-containing protein n=1 Tax=Kwoniella shivajii TaxID=564305 RepID=A0ABZ1D0S4_9TREE|nr:hypothetical protein IL334_004458 [Kwoniella shivajii]